MTILCPVARAGAVSFAPLAPEGRLEIIEKMDGGPNDIQRGRERIDELDTQIVDMLQERARLAKQIGAAKDAASRTTYAPDREREVMERAQSHAGEGPLTAAQLGAIYRQIISACRATERELRVHIIGFVRGCRALVE